MCDGYPGHRTAVILRAAVEQLVHLRPLQLGPLSDLTIQTSLIGPHYFALKHGHVPKALRMVVFEVFVEGIRFNSVFDIGFMDSKSINRIMSTFPKIGTGFSGFSTECTLASVECPPPGVAGSFDARPTWPAAVLLVHAAGLVKLDQLGLGLGQVSIKYV